MKIINDTMLKNAIGLGGTPSGNKKYYDWKKREHLKQLILLAKKGLLYEQAVSDATKKELEDRFLKI